MRVIWLCNNPPKAVSARFGNESREGNWLDHVLEDILKISNIQIKVLFRDSKAIKSESDSHFGFASFQEDDPSTYYAELEEAFLGQLKNFAPDLIHIWGTEYGHTLAMVNAAQQADLLDNVVVSIQGLCSVIASHYCDGLPNGVIRCKTFRDLLKKDNLLQQRAVFEKRGRLEIQALQKVSHVIGRTPWDYSWTLKYNPSRIYHFCNETLRSPFYTGSWNYQNCSRHTIFVSSCSYPIKGFHYLLEAMAFVLKEYPDASIRVTGSGYYPSNVRGMLRLQSYQVYLRRLTGKYGLKNKIVFLGKLSSDGMKNEMLRANVFVLPSVIENSPNSLGEAMLLGVPCIAADVGGVSALLSAPKEGIIYPSDDVELLAKQIMDVFAAGETAESMGAAASSHARITHDPDNNLKALLDIYKTVSKNNEDLRCLNH